MENKFNLPTEVVELPSKGKLYAPDSPLATGTVFKVLKLWMVMRPSPTYLRQDTHLQ